MNVDALQYRIDRGLDRAEEQMALLVQRVSGAYRGRYFFPDFAGVGLSYNTFVWDAAVDPHAGLLRLVFGLGTRATARSETDYPRLAALDRPTAVPFDSRESRLRFSQRSIDLLDIDENCLTTLPISALFEDGIPLPEVFTVTDRNGRGGLNRFLTFDTFLAESGFADDMRRMLATLERTYGYPVDMEFTATFTDEGRLRINLIQCRPLQTQGVHDQRQELPETLE